MRYLCEPQYCLDGNRDDKDTTCSINFLHVDNIRLLSIDCEETAE
jgi:hypothetical protein